MNIASTIGRIAAVLATVSALTAASRTNDPEGRELEPDRKFTPFPDDMEVDRKPCRSHLAHERREFS